MKTLRLVLFASVAALLVAASLPAAAAALPTHNFTLHLRSGTTQYASGFDGTGKWTLRIMRSAVEIYRVDRGTGFYSWSAGIALQPGDEFQIWEYGALDPIPPLVNPDETLIVPQISATGAAGSPAVSGAASDGWSLRVSRDHPCAPDDSYSVTQSGGAWGLTLPTPLRPNEEIRASLRANGDVVDFDFETAGDSGCVEFDARRGTSTSATPFGVEYFGLDPVVPTTRMVLRRGGVAIVDVNSDDVNLPDAQKPLPGDVLEVYRPKDASAPTYTVAMPAVTGVFDPGNDLAAADGPEGAYSFSVCRPVDCIGDAMRSQNGALAGRKVFNFGLPGANDGPFDLRSDDVMSLNYISNDWLTEYSTDVLPGDLTPPTGSIVLARLVKLSKLRRVMKFKLSSSEAGSISARLRVKRPPKRAGKSASKMVTLGSVNRTVAAGTNTITLKLSRAGKKLIKQLAAAGGRHQATLELSLTDGAGNTTNLSKRTKLTALH